MDEDGSLTHSNARSASFRRAVPPPPRLERNRVVRAPTSGSDSTGKSTALKSVTPSAPNVSSWRPTSDSSPITATPAGVGAPSRRRAGVTGRIIPTDAEPGAIEAGCVNFIDKALANEDARALPLYRLGVSGTDAVAKERFAKAFVELDPTRQDRVLIALESGQAPGWPEGPISAPVFFETVRAHTIIGFLADPKYGGNRDYAGWKLVGYPGPRHHLGGYTPEQMLGKAKIKTIWGGEL